MPIPKTPAIATAFATTDQSTVVGFAATPRLELVVAAAPSAASESAVEAEVEVEVTVKTGEPVDMSSANCWNQDLTSGEIELYQAGVLPASNSEAMLDLAAGSIRSTRTEPGTAVMMATWRLDGTEMPSVTEAVVYCWVTGNMERREALFEFVRHGIYYFGLQPSFNPERTHNPAET